MTAASWRPFRMNLVFGWFWIVFGSFVAARPGILRGWFAWSAGGKLKWVIWPVVIMLILQLAALVGQIHTPLLKKIGWAVLAVLAVLLWTLQSRARTKFRAWCQSLPLWIFQAAGVFNILTGALLVRFSLGP